MTDGAYPRDKHLTAIAIAYKNPELNYIADAVMPRVPVGKLTFEYWEYPLGQGYDVPSTNVGERSKVNTVEIGGTRKAATCEDKGIEITLTANDISQAPKGVDPRERATEQSTDIILRDRERRVAALVFNTTSYPAGRQIDLGDTATTQWSDYTNADPLSFIHEKLDSCPIRPNVMAFGQPAWTKLAMHPKVVKAVNGNDGGHGRATRQQIAELLELSEVLVGNAFVNSVKPGKTPVLARCWGKHAVAFFRDQSVGTSGGLTFGFTAQFEERMAGSKPIDIGMRGGVGVRAGETVKELIVAPDAAFFFENAVA
jgi:hypothetical protein